MSAGRAGDAARIAALDDVLEELRALGLLALDRLDPLVGRLNRAVSAPPEPNGTSDGHRCTACPVCVALTERGDALAQVAEHAAHLVAALRVALSDVDPAGRDAEPAPQRPERIVQHIPVERTSAC